MTECSRHVGEPLENVDPLDAAEASGMTLLLTDFIASEPTDAE